MKGLISRAAALTAILVLAASAAGQAVSFPGSWYDQDKYHLDSEPTGGQSWEVEYGWWTDRLLNGGAIFTPGQQVDDTWVPTLKYDITDNSCWIASAANMMAARTGSTSYYYAWAYANGVNGTVTDLAGNPKSINYTFADRGYQHWALQSAGFSWLTTSPPV